MPKFCGFCGTQTEDTDFICGNCGRPVQQSQTPVQSVSPATAEYADFAQPVEEYQSYYTQQPKTGKAAKKVKKPSIKLNFDFNKLADTATTHLAGIVAGVRKGDKKSLITVSSAAAILIAVLIVIISAFSVGGEKKAAEKVLKAVSKNDAQSVVKLVPKFFYSPNIIGVTQTEEDWLGIFDERIETFRNLASDKLESEDFTMSWEITDVDFYGENELKTLTEVFEIYEEFKDKKLKKGALVNVEVVCKKGGEKYFSEFEVYVYKYGSSWYVQKWADVASVQN